MFNLLDINNSWLGRLVAMSILVLIYSTPYFVLTSYGFKSAYKLIDFVFISHPITNLLLLAVLAFSILSSHYLVKPQSHAEWLILKKNNPVNIKTLTLNNLIGDISEEIIFRYVLFYSLATFLIIFHTPEILIALIFVGISSHLFAKAHQGSVNRDFYNYYLISGILLGLVFLLCGILGSILIHFAFNKTKRFAMNYYLTHPI